MSPVAFLAAGLVAYLTQKGNPAMSDEITQEPGAEQIKGDIAEQLHDEHVKGYVGDKVDPRPNTDYSMEGGAPGITGQPGAPDGGPTTDQENQ